MAEEKKDSRELLKEAIGWEENYVDLERSHVRRINWIDKITVLILLILFDIFHKNFKDLHTFLSKLVPLDFDLPDYNKFRKMYQTVCDKRLAYKKVV